MALCSLTVTVTSVVITQKVSTNQTLVNVRLSYYLLVNTEFFFNVLTVVTDLFNILYYNKDA